MPLTHLVHFGYVELGGVLLQSDSLVAGLEVRHNLREAPLHLLAADEADHPGCLGLQAGVLGQVVSHREPVVLGDVAQELLLVVELGAGASLGLTLVLATCEPGDHRGGDGGGASSTPWLA